ncbi:MAG: cytochrome c oxidase cbb3-type subunit 4 [Alphaproteobacteria bacterium]|jgi:cytochrome c oxidase cbb3-type subunit 4
MQYEDIARFAGTWGLLYMIVLFAIGVAYALWPKNRAKFERASRRALDDDAPPPPRLPTRGRKP